MYRHWREKYVRVQHALHTHSMAMARSFRSLNPAIILLFLSSFSDLAPEIAGDFRASQKCPFNSLEFVDGA